MLCTLQLFANLKINTLEQLSHNFGALFTFIFGIISFLHPLKISKLVSLTPHKQYGIAEIRATYGGWIFGLAAYSIYAQNSEVFTCLGIGYLALVVGKTMKFILTEIIIGLLLLI